MKINLSGETYAGRSRQQNAQECVNWYPETDQTGKHRVVLYPTPGLTSFATVGGGPIRGMRQVNDLLYVVSGASLYRVTTDGVATFIAFLSTATGQVSMSHNINQVAIVDGVSGYIYNTDTAVFSAIGAYFPASATHIRFLDGYFLANDLTNRGRFWRSNSYDGTTWGALAYATAERSPDALSAIEVNDRIAYLFGEGTTELWYNDGTDQDNPLLPIPNVIFPVGILAPHSVDIIDKYTLWLAKDEHGQGQVMVAQGTSYAKISTYAVENTINGYSTLSDAIAYTYQQGGHQFYVLTFPNANATWCYDLTEKKWHTRKSFGYGRQNTQNVEYFASKVLIGSSLDGSVYELDLDSYTDNGTAREYVRVLPPINDEEDATLLFQVLKLDFEVGTGNASDPTPTVGLDWSNDGGMTWGNRIFRSLGALGTYFTEVTFRKLGRSKNRVFRIAITSKAKVALLGGYVEVHGGKKTTNDEPKV